MDKLTIAEEAYKRGYEKGLKDAVKHGHWLNWKGEPMPKDDFGWTWICSECKNTLEYEEPVTAEEFPSNYCPNCGAKMDGGAEDAQRGKEVPAQD